MYMDREGNVAINGGFEYGNTIYGYIWAYIDLELVL